MPLPPVDSNMRLLVRRMNEAKSAGIHPQVYSQLAANEYNKILGGGSMMSQSEWDATVASGARDKPVIADPGRPKGHGLLSDITTTLGNVPSDVGGILRGFIPGVVKSTVHAPSELATFAEFFQHNLADSGESRQAWDVKHGFEAPVQGQGFGTLLGEGVRNAAKLMGRDVPAPLQFAGMFAPGLQTVANATTKQGREQIAAHPASTLLDLLPAAAEAGQAIAPADAAAFSPAEALSKGNPVKAAVRQVADIIPGIDRDVIRDHLHKMGLDPAMSEKLMRPMSTLNKKARANILTWFKENIPDDLRNLTPEERVKLQDASINAKEDLSNVPPEMVGHVATLRRLTEAMRAEAVNAKEGMNIDVGGGKTAYYTYDSPVAVAARSLERVDRNLDYANNRLSQAQRVLDERTAHLDEATGKVRHFYERPEDFAARPHGPVGPAQVSEAAQSFVEAFRNLDPRTVFEDYVNKIVDPTVAAATKRALDRSFAKLAGENGLVAKFADAIKGEDAPGKVYYHATPEANVEGIKAKGLTGDQIFGFATREQAEAYARLLRSRKPGFDKPAWTVVPFRVTEDQIAKQKYVNPEWGDHIVTKGPVSADQVFPSERGGAPDFKAARETLTQIAQVMRSKAWDKFAHQDQLRGFVNELRDQMKGLYLRSRTYSYRQSLVDSATERVAIEQAAVDKYRGLSSSHRETFLEKMHTNAPANFHPMIQEHIRAGMMERANTIYQGQTLNDIALQIKNGTSFAELRSTLPEGEFNSLYEDSIRSWWDLRQQGFDPVWLHTVTSSNYESIFHPTVLPEHYTHLQQLHDKAFNFGHTIHDPVAAVTSAAAERIRDAATREYINRHVMPIARPGSEILLEYYKAAEKNNALAAHQSPAEWANQQFNAEYMKFDPAKYGVRRAGNVAPTDVMYLPKQYANALDQITAGFERGRRLPIKGAYDRGMHLYKFAVLTSPRHLAHVTLGGMMFLGLRDPIALTDVAEGFRAAKDGTVPPQVLVNLHDVSTDQVFHLAAGRTMARVVTDFLGKGPKAMERFESYFNNSLRATEYLSQIKRGADMEQAMQAVNKTFIDMDGMLPLERTVMKQVFPFYAFTKHVLKYVLTLPVDHPMRVSILSRLANQEQEDWTSGLPQKFQSLFMLGHPDKNGNVLSIDYKNLNPFRSAANDFTLTGFLSGVNPLVSMVMQAAGVNILQGASELYPQMYYDTTNGTLAAKRPGVPLTMAGSIIPEVGALDHFIQFNDSMKALKKTDPAAYRKQLFTSLGIPFAPVTYNIPYEQERAESKRFQAAQTSLTAAEKSGNFTDAERFNAVPFRGGIASPTGVAALMAELARLVAQAHSPVTDPAALLPPVRRPSRRP